WQLVSVSNGRRAFDLSLVSPGTDHTTLPCDGSTMCWPFNSAYSSRSRIDAAFSPKQSAFSWYRTLGSAAEDGTRYSYTRETSSIVISEHVSSLSISENGAFQPSR